MQHLPRRAIAVIVALTLAALLAAVPALAAPVTVNLRIEGKSQTWFEGPVTTDVRPVDGHDNSGPHTCDGTNNGQGGTPSPTAGTALADGAESSTPFSFVAKYFPPDPNFGGDDFFLQTVQGETPDFNADQTFWGFYMNGTAASSGMCEARAQQGDRVLFAVVKGSETILSLAGPPSADVGQPVTFTVTDAANGSPVGGADVGGQVSDAGGHATLTFDSPGTRSFKATRANAVRSNAVAVCVHQGDDGTCGASGPAAFSPSAGAADRLPTARILGIRDGQRFTTRTAPRLLRGHSDPGSAGLTAVDLRLRRAFAIAPARPGRPAPRRTRTPGFTGRAITRCQFYSALSERFRAGRCDARYFLYKVSDRENWSYLLPLRPAAGRYVMDVVAKDRRGRRASARVRFTVVEARR
jgi:hypothetical protein